MGCHKPSASRIMHQRERKTHPAISSESSCRIFRECYPCRLDVLARGDLFRGCDRRVEGAYTLTSAACGILTRLEPDALPKMFEISVPWYGPSDGAPGYVGKSPNQRNIHVGTNLACPAAFFAAGQVNPVSVALTAAGEAPGIS